MVDPVNFERVTALPNIPQIDTIYFVLPDDAAYGTQYVTGHDGVPVLIGTPPVTGRSIVAIQIDADGYLIISYSDGTTENAGQVGGVAVSIDNTLAGSTTYFADNPAWQDRFRAMEALFPVTAGTYAIDYDVDTVRTAFEILEARADANENPPAPVLNVLTVSNGSAAVGTAFSAAVYGLTSGSSVSLTGAGAAGLSISGGTITGTPTTAGSLNVIETLAGASNSPRTTSGLVTVSAVPSSGGVFSSGAWTDTAAWDDTQFWRDAA
jgi:hypothetical protein